MNTDPAPPDRNLLSRWTGWIVTLVVGAMGGGVFALLKQIGRDRKPADLPDSFVYDVERYKVIPADRIGYREVAKIDTGFTQATALAVGPEDEIVVGGDREVRVYSRDGTLRHSIPADGTPLALTVSAEGGLYVALEDVVHTGKIPGPLTKLLTLSGEDARITSIAVDRRAVFVADAGSRGVWRFTLSGEPLGRIGDRDEDRDIPGFAVPSPYFDLLVAPDGLLRVVDPGRHQIRAFTTDGDLELSWGRASFDLEGFCGCCNPSHMTMLPDGRFVTSEKGIPRVKVYDADGRFVTAVVGSDGLSTETEPCDVAADSRGRILVLDPGAGAVRVFESKERSARDE